MRPLQRTSWLVPYLLLVLVLITACAPLPTAPAGGGEAAQAPAAEQATLPDLTVGDVFFYSRGFGPPDIASFFDYRIASQLYEGLVAWDGPGMAKGDPAEPKPALAESWTVSDDGLVYTFKIRTGVTFSTGRPVTAAAVKASFERSFKVLEANDLTSRYGWVTSVTGVDAPDDATFTLTLKESYAPLLSALASVNFAIVDVEEAMANESEGDLGAKWLAEHSAGAGPFMLEEYLPEQKLTLRRNPTYWGGGDGVQPGVERVIFAHVPENATRQLMVGSGELDIALQLDPTSLETLSGNADIKVEKFPALLTCNFLVDLRTEALANNYPKVLQALRYAIDYEGFRTVVAGDLADVRLTNFLPGMAGYDPSQDSYYSYDPEKAKALMAEAGYADGFEIKILNRPGSCGSVAYAKATEFWQQNLAAIGIRAEINETTGANFWGAVGEGALRDIGISGAGATYLDADHPATVRAVQESQMLGWKEIAAESATRAEELASQGRAEIDPQKRQAIYQEIAQLMLDSSPYLTFLQVQDPVVMRQNVSGGVGAPGYFPIALKYITKQ